MSSCEERRTTAVIFRILGRSRMILGMGAVTVAALVLAGCLSGPAHKAPTASFRHGEHRERESHIQPLPGNVVLSPDAERFFQSLDLTSPDLIQKARLLLLPNREISAKDVSDLADELMSDRRPEAQRLAADLLAGANEGGPYRLFVLRRVAGQAGSEMAYFLAKVQVDWDVLGPKELQALGHDLPYILTKHKDDPHVCASAESIVARMIAQPGKLVPLAGIRAAEEAGLKSDVVIAALRGQITNDVYNYFDNAHPIRAAAAQALGEPYEEQKREPIDYAAISIARRDGLKKSDGLTVGLLTDLWTAEGPCLGGGDGYGWGGQLVPLYRLPREHFAVLGYCHPITEVDRLPVGAKFKEAGYSDRLLNSASPEDLALSDVVILASMFDLRAEVVDALEQYVWKGGGIVTLSGAGIIAAQKRDKLAALQDMDGLQWSWGTAPNETCEVRVKSPLTDGLDFSIPFAFMNRNGYEFGDRRYEPQILLWFRQLNEPALRVSTYGKGRIAHFAWNPTIGDDAEGCRNWELLRRTILWAAGREYTDFRPQPAFSAKRYEN